MSNTRGSNSTDSKTETCVSDTSQTISFPSFYNNLLHIVHFKPCNFSAGGTNKATEVDEDEQSLPETTFQPKCNTRLNRGIGDTSTTDEIIAMAADLEQKKTTTSQRVKGMTKDEAKAERTALNETFEKIQNYYNRALVMHFTQLKNNEGDKTFNFTTSFSDLYNQIHGLTEDTDAQETGNRRRKKQNTKQVQHDDTTNVNEENEDDDESVDDEDFIRSPTNSDLDDWPDIQAAISESMKDQANSTVRILCAQTILHSFIA